MDEQQEVVVVGPMEAIHVRPYAKEIWDLCASKVEEFRLLGYDQVQVEELWRFVCAEVPSDTPLYRLVDFILSIRVMDFMNHQTIAAYRGEID